MPSSGIPPSRRSRLHGLAWLPVALALLGIAGGSTADFRLALGSSSLLLLLNLVFSGLTSLLIAFLIGRTYLVGGLPDLLMVGCGALVWGAASIASGTIGMEGIDAAATTFSLMACLSALLHLIGAILATRSRVRMNTPAFYLAVAYLLCTGTVAAIFFLSLQNRVPPFFVEAEGGTTLWHAFLTASILMFLVAGLVLRVKNRAALSPFLDWYTLALLLLAIGVFGVMTASAMDSLLSWVGRLVLYLGGIYMFVAAAVAAPEPEQWAISLRAALLEATRRYADLFNLSADGILIHEPVTESSRGRIRQCNAAACALLGYTEEEICEQTLLDLIAAEDRNSIEPRITRSPKGSVTRREETLIARDGRRIPTDITTRTFDSGTGAMAMSVIRDITVRRQAEEALRESEERLRLTLRAAQIGTFDFRPQTGDVLLDDRAKAQWGLAGPANWTYTGILEQVHPDDRERFQRDVNAALDSSSSGIYESEFRSTWRDGSVHWHTSKGRVYFEGPPDSRRAVRLLGVDLDSTERKQAELLLSEAMQRINAHIDNSPLAVIEFDPEFRVSRWSDAAQRLFGWTSEEILGRSLYEMPWVFEEDLEAVARLSEKMLSGESPRNLGINRNYRRDGSIVECEWYNSAIYDTEGKLSSVLSQVLDVTGRKRTEERLRQAQKMESIALLAGGVAHDFNNLLVGVIGNASLAAERLPAGNPAADLLDGIIKAGEQAAHLTRQMLAYSGQGRFVMQPVDLSDVVRDVTDLVRSTAPRKIAIELHLQPHLPAIEADRSQIHQVLMNLVINATEAIGDRSGMITIETRVEQLKDEHIQEFRGGELVPGRYISLRIRDTGVGMDEATKAKIFDPFFTTKFQGRGLGLAAVAGIVRSHKGALRVTSTPAKGTCFQLLFPLKESLSLPQPPRRSVQEVAVGGFARCGTVLVVDDEERVQMADKLALERRGCSVLTAGTGQEAIDILRSNPEPVRLVILDVGMPGLSSPETLTRMLEIKPGLDVLVCSGYAESEVLRLFEGMPIAGFIQKPYTSQQFANRVKEHFGRRREQETTRKRRLA